MEVGHLSTWTSTQFHMPSHASRDLALPSHHFLLSAGPGSISSPPLDCASLPGPPPRSHHLTLLHLLSRPPHPHRHTVPPRCWESWADSKGKVPTPEGWGWLRGPGRRWLHHILVTEGSNGTEPWQLSKSSEQQEFSGELCDQLVPLSQMSPEPLRGLKGPGGKEDDIPALWGEENCSYKWSRPSGCSAWSKGVRKAGRLERHGHLGVAPGALGRRKRSGLGRL